MKRLGHVLLGLLLLAVGCAGSGGKVPSDAAVHGAERHRIGVMPFANYCRQGEAGRLMLPLITGGLARAGLEVVGGPELRPALRRHRIRSQGMIGSRDAHLLASELDLDYFLLGSWDVYVQGDNLELGLSLRVLDAGSLELVRAVSRGRTAVDEVGWLGLGRVDSLGTLAELLVRDALSGILPLGPAGKAPGDLPPVAVIPLDNLSETDHAGAVCGSVLVSRLMARGFPVIEPGFIRELQLETETAYRGGIDREDLQTVVRVLQPQVVITGTVDVFAPVVGDPAVGVPEVALGLRMIAPHAGRVLLAREISLKGSDSDGWFQRGRIHGLTRLAARVCDRFVDDLETEIMTSTEGKNP